MSLMTPGMLEVSQKLSKERQLKDDFRFCHDRAGGIKNFLTILNYKFLNFGFDKKLISATLLTFNIFLGSTIPIINCISFVWLQVSPPPPRQTK